VRVARPRASSVPIGAISVIGMILALAACAVSPSLTPNSSQASSLDPTSSRDPSSVPSGAPSVNPSLIIGFLFSDILAVEVNGLAVRVAPTLTSPLAQGVGENAEPMGDVRLGVGDFVSVQLGPLPIGEIVWYLVWPAEDARLGYSTLWWDTNGDDPDGGVNPGWVAASRRRLRIRFQQGQQASGQGGHRQESQIAQCRRRRRFLRRGARRTR